MQNFSALILAGQRVLLLLLSTHSRMLFLLCWFPVLSDPVPFQMDFAEAELTLICVSALFILFKWLHSCQILFWYFQFWHLERYKGGTAKVFVEARLFFLNIRHPEWPNTRWRKDKRFVVSRPYNLRKGSKISFLLNADNSILHQNSLASECSIHSALIATGRSLFCITVAVDKKEPIIIRWMHCSLNVHSVLQLKDHVSVGPTSFLVLPMLKDLDKWRLVQG